MTGPDPVSGVPLNPEALRDRIHRQLWLAGVRVGLDVCTDAAMVAVREYFAVLDADKETEDPTASA